MTVLGIGSIIAQLRKELHRRGEGRLYILWQDGFVRMMAEAAGAAKEEHGGGNRGGENHRVVAGSAGHPAGWKACLSGGFIQEGGQVRIEWDLGLLELPGGCNVHPASGGGGLPRVLEGRNAGPPQSLSTASGLHGTATLTHRSLTPAL